MAAQPFATASFSSCTAAITSCGTLESGSGFFSLPPNHGGNAGLSAPTVSCPDFTRARLSGAQPGTVVAEVLDPIPAGLEKREFLKRLQSSIEQATARLVAEGARSAGRD